MKTWTRKRTLFAVAFLTLTLLATVGLALSAQAAKVGSRASSCPNPGVFTGHDDTGDFQLALEDAIAEAATCAGCCDLLITYEVTKTTGRAGGFAGFDDIYVTIVATH